MGDRGLSLRVQGLTLYQASLQEDDKNGREFLRRRGSLILGLNAYDGRLNHDLYDAIVDAYTAYLHSRGEMESLRRSEEVCIVVTRATAGVGRS